MAKKPTASLIAGKTLKEIIWNPSVYAPYALVAVGNAMMPVSPWLNIPALLAVTAGNIWYWRRNWNCLYQKHEFEEEANYRKTQNAELKQRLGGNAGQEMPPRHVADMLAALQAKIEIEQKILEDGNITLRGTRTARNHRTNRESNDPGDRKRHRFPPRRIQRRIEHPGRN